ncbi:AtpZ/AtpI family protein [Fodinicola acaciae]|uniref:AtpZ/AtpI family protein n=1 Tax=Fodinicola acaciae TaxID=2681555 RepID=UPI0013D60124|nr:AtpZ/AtpI family protein [Fodinicola acaciae]
MSGASPDGPGLWQLVTLGSTLLGFVVGGLVIGLLIDNWTHAGPVFLMIGLGVGIVGGLLTAGLQIRRFLKG